MLPSVLSVRHDAVDDAVSSIHVLDVESAAKSMNEMRKNYVCFKRAYEDKSQNPMWACIHEYFVEKYSDLAKKSRVSIPSIPRPGTA